ncbi:alpha/beta hydrolase [Salipiger marinus]|uniref:Esterase/lipase superfamily enzyme n=1 Tax=Salipiger marinus TaxID=555512 RepID=A0A1G8T856_9RHOB|nr:alpha/beta fold hydrolase [Salipiger marinus]SDJ37779.1 Esterase/lipase superfamily enzyme [Salipiger marinus]
MRALLLALFMLLAACTPRPGPEALTPQPAPGPDLRVVRVYVATTRAPMAPPAIGFGAGPAIGMSYRWYDISVPEQPRARGVFWMTDTPDPSQDFLVVGHGALDRSGFAAEVAQRNAQAAEPVTVFVHGYNYSFPEALLELARLTAETGRGGAPVLFSWPSQGKVLDYVGDRQEALASRDALARVLADVSRAEGRTLLAGHSMGGWLTMEALRTLALAGRRDVTDDLDVLLIAPDIDPLVFRQQLAPLQPLPRPLTVMVARDDRALAMSSRISTGRTRLGALNVDDPVVARAAQSADVQLIDISGLPAVNALHHNRYTELARMVAERGSDSGDPLGLVRSAGAFVLDTLGSGLIRAGQTIGGG